MVTCWQYNKVSNTFGTINNNNYDDDTLYFVKKLRIFQNSSFTGAFFHGLNTSIEFTFYSNWN